jgi:hypothetical protein
MHEKVFLKSMCWLILNQWSNGEMRTEEMLQGLGLGAETTARARLFWILCMEASLKNATGREI